MVVLFLVLLAGCKGHTDYGECVGLDDDEKVKGLIYKFSVRNAVWSVVGFETIIAPILWMTDYARCPVGRESGDGQP